METAPVKTPPYDAIQQLMGKLGGEMKWVPGGGPGGVWHLILYGRTTDIQVRDDRPNGLDNLYERKTDNPKSWDDFGEFREDAFWELVKLFR